MTFRAAEPPPLSRPARYVVALVMLVYLALASWGAWSKSETYDEPMYVLAAYSYVVTGDFSLNREHPPLAKLLMGLPMLALDLELPADYQQQPGIAYSFFAHQPRVDAHTLLFTARLGGILLGLVLGAYVLRWARLAFGNTAGLAALALCLLNPNILAHCRVAANDMAPTVFLFACGYHAWRWLDTRSRRSLLFMGITLGLALGSKLSALFILPVLGLLVLVLAVARRRPALLLEGTLALVAAGSVLHILYLGEMRTLDQARAHVRFDAPEGRAFDDERIEDSLEAVFGSSTPIPLMSFIKGFDHQRSHNQTGHITYFWGRKTITGSPFFFVAATLIKLPEGLILLLLLAVFVWRRTWRGATHEVCLLGASAMHYLVLSSADVQLGFKYALAAVPCLVVMACRVFADDARPGRTPRVAACALLAFAVGADHLFEEPQPRRLDEWLPLLLSAAAAGWLLFGKRPAPQRWAASCGLLAFWGLGDALSRQPDNLMYFNRWAGGPDRGHHYFVVGDDWGQDTAGLGRWMKEQGLDFLRYDYYGTGDPAVWGVRHAPTKISAGYVPEPGFFAVHVSILRRVPYCYTWLEGLEPIHHIGGSILIYDLSAEHIADWLVRRDAAKAAKAAEGG